MDQHRRPGDAAIAFTQPKEDANDAEHVLSIDVQQKILRDLNIVIQEILRDPDLLQYSADYREGYARGMREAFLSTITERLKWRASQE